MDDADLTDARGTYFDDATIKRIRENASIMPCGVEGICVECELFSKRLVSKLCAPCRDTLKKG